MPRRDTGSQARGTSRRTRPGGLITIRGTAKRVTTPFCCDAGPKCRRAKMHLRRLPIKMTASTRLVGGVTIVDLSGRIVLGEGSAGLRDLVRDLVSEGIKKILLNLHNVDYIDSSGLGELVNAFTSMRSQGGELKLLNL